MNLQMIKKSMLAYVSAVKFVWSAIAYPLSIVGKKLMNLRGYRVYGNSVQDGTPTPETPIEIESVGDLSTKNLLDIDSFDSFNTSHIKYNPETKIITNNWGMYGSGAPFLSNITSLDVGVYSISCEVLPQYKDAIYIGVRGLDAEGNFKQYYKSLLGENMPPVGVWTRISVSITVDTHIDMTERSSRCGITVQNGGWAENYTSLNLQIRNVMIAEGDVATDYEPYHKYKIPVVARGRNLIKLNTKSYSANGGTIINNKDGTYTLSGTPTGYCGLVIGSIPSSLLDVLRNNVCVLTGFYYYEKNVRITLNVKLNGSYIKYIYLSPYTYKNYVQVDLRTTEFDEITVSLSNQNDNVDFDNVTVKPLLEVGTTMPTSFEPYIAPVTKNIYLDEPLRKVGDYADYIDYEKQKVVRNVKRKDFDGSEEWTIQSVNGEEYHNFYTDIILNARKIMSILSNRITGYNQYPLENNGLISSSGRLNVCFFANTIDDWKATLSSWSTDGIPLIINYILETPIEESVKLPALPQFKGTTIYEVGTSIKPSGMEAKYC